MVLISPTTFQEWPSPAYPVATSLWLGNEGRKIPSKAISKWPLNRGHIQDFHHLDDFPYAIITWTFWTLLLVKYDKRWYYIAQTTHLRCHSFEEYSVVCVIFCCWWAALALSHDYRFALTNDHRYCVIVDLWSTPHFLFLTLSKEYEIALLPILQSNTYCKYSHACALED